MKKVFLGLAALLMIVGMVGCSSNSPKPVAEKFLTSFWHMDYKEAKKYATQDTKDMLDMLEQLSTTMPDSDKVHARNIKVDVKDVKEEGDKAVVTFVTSDIKDEKQLNLVKQDGQWLVNLTKNDNIGGEEGPEEEPVTQDTTSAAVVPDTTGVAQ
jgi:hypothetical protein